MPSFRGYGELTKCSNRMTRTVINQLKRNVSLIMKAKILLFLLLVPCCFATTYYIDYATGSDSNNGRATTTPWKRHPYMTGWAGSYTHVAGDVFIFKGGVTWPAACFPLKPGAGGSSTGGSDIYKGDPSWYAG